jgi:3-mercaptopyruvate sulfurtransferase SseA
MPKIRTFSLVFVVLLAIVACNFIAPTQEIQAPVTVIVEPTSSAPRSGNVPLSEAEVPRVSLEEARAALESGAAIVVDVRSGEAYQASHIAGAISIPLGVIETNAASLELDKDQWIITYCT